MLDEIEHPAGMIEQLVNGYLTGDVRMTIQPIFQRIVQLEPTFMTKLKDKGCQVIFTDTTNIEKHIFCYWCLGSWIRHTTAPDPDGLIGYDH